VSFASVGPRAELRDTIRSTGAHRIILDGIWTDGTAEAGGCVWPEVVYAHDINGTELHLSPVDHDRVLRAWRRYEAAVDLPAEVAVYPALHVTALGEGECPGCGGSGDADEPADGMDDRAVCPVCVGRGVTYQPRADALGGDAA
jgi:hypothetical protein